MSNFSNTLELLSHLKELGVELSMVNEKLCIDAPKGVITPSLHEELARRKEEIIQFFTDSASSSGSESMPLSSVSRDEKLPISFSQQRLWFLSQMDPENRAYVLPNAIRIQGKLNIDAFKRSLTEIYCRHEALRTIFKATEDDPEQVILPPNDLPVPIVDLTDLTDDERESEVQRLILEDVEQPFNLAKGPLLRVKIMRLGQEEHVFSLTMHHIISDGWSNGVLLKELSALYSAFCAGQPSPLPPLPLQYVDYAFWQRKWLQGDVLEGHLAHWRQQLGGDLPVLQLPTDRPRPAVQSYRGAKKALSLPGQLKTDLEKLSRDESVTLFMTLLAAFYALLYRYTGQEDITIGSPIANRTRPELENLIGFFVNTLTLRIDLSGDPNFIQILKRVREAALAAYNHQDVPFEKLVEELKPVRDMSYSPLFQVMFSWQNVPKEPANLPGLTLTRMSIDSGASMFDLTIYMWEEDNGLVGKIEYNTDLFEDATIVRLHKHFQTLLEGIIANPESRVRDLPILDDAEREQLLLDWNDTKVEYPQDKCLHDLFEEQVERTPDAVAVVSGDQQLTYRELNARANQLAHYLISKGVGPEEMVGLYMERSLEMVIGIYGIIKAGGAYVPLDPEYPPDRIAFMVEETDVPVLLTQKHLVNSLTGPRANVICLDSEWDVINAEPAHNPNSGVKPENLAYVIYTSGSTGRPKGVMNEHRGIVNRLLWMQDEYNLDREDRILQKTPFSFDVSVWEFFWPLLTGARLVVARPGGHKDPAYLVDIIVEHQITTLHFVPSMLQIFLEEEDVVRCHSIKRVICSGEALPYDLQCRFFEILDTELHNLYGPTEAAVDVTYWPCRQDQELKIVPIGYPVANTQMYILDPQLQPVPIGCTGELHIGGIQVARGYLKRPELTAEKFIPDPFSTDPKARLYKTGDLSRFLPDGCIEYLGRTDFQVKMRGLRIELGEIEARVTEFPHVNQCIVLMREDRPGDKRLVAYLSTEEDQSVSISELRGHLSETLPDYMVPPHFVVLDSIPLSANGKADRRALPKPKIERRDEEAYAAPRSKTEQKIADIWKELLQISRVGINDSFFDLGGHSLLLPRMLRQLKADFGNQLSIVNLFQYPTVAALADFMNTNIDSGASLDKRRALASKQRASLLRKKKAALAVRR
jgi:amino acid adenylation domain-containing protein